MNNEQFRRLLLEKEAASKNGSSASPPGPSAKPRTAALGTRKASFMPMTPRTVKGAAGVDFARQVQERNAAASGQQGKRWKSSAAPKGSKLAAGYQDRTLERKDYEDDEKGARIKALEEQMKLGQLDQATFEALRDQITGGNVSTTHLVKGLDRKLLERVRRGEDVIGGGTKEAEEDIDEELDRLEEKEVARLEREKTQKKGEVAKQPRSVAGAKRTRDQILADLKAQRKAAAEARNAARPELGAAFRDIASKQHSGTRIERDDKGREVMITVDEHGNVKKKVRKVQPGNEINDPEQAAEKPIKFLDEGITIPTLKEQKKEVPKEESEDEGDIFGDVGTDYNPLGEADDSDDDDDDSSDSGEEGEIAARRTNASKEEVRTSRSPRSVSSSVEADSETKSMPPPPLPVQIQKKPIAATTRNYFRSAAPEPTEEAPQNPFNDSNFLAAIKKASALSNVAFSLGGDSKDEDGEEDEAAKEARLKKRAAMLANNDRDFEDMDLGFGSSRGGDDEDAAEGGSKIKLSQWKGSGATGDDDDDDGGHEGGGGGKKKRSRKRKGDKNSAADVLGVLERRKESNK
ncbi:hypothetical protein AAFC00_001194 [Neodothiora populina]|uniref:RED-like N-terminal domain-containing protein n=1 Tax=Neodothiora populina TaxID=2781224 RepID=A0ABR3PP40_9PEZI